MACPVGPGRDLLARRNDGRIVAHDQVWRGTALTLTPLAARDGRYPLAVSPAPTAKGDPVIDFAANFAR